MKTTLLSAVILLSLTSMVFAAERSPACEAKRANIEAQIAEAVAKGRTQQVEGLKRALAANQAHCTDASLAKERDEDIQKAQEKVAEREKSLAEAKLKGDADKIAKKQAKLDEARRALTEAQKPIGQ